MASEHSATPQQDTGWGVIYRLNDLFKEVETFAINGKYDDWNFRLDRIWSNLCYRHKFKVNKDEKTSEITSIEFDEESYNIKCYFDKLIVEQKIIMSKARKLDATKDSTTDTRKEIIRAKNELYKRILMKEIWLRKYMQELGLYLKETKYNPAGAMWGQ